MEAPKSPRGLFVPRRYNVDGQCGHITLVGILGGDHTPVDAARVSFARGHFTARAKLAMPSAGKLAAAAAPGPVAGVSDGLTPIDPNAPYTDGDRKLLQYLLDNEHWSVVRHTMLQVVAEMPEGIARQLYKHVVGTELTSTHPMQVGGGGMGIWTGRGLKGWGGWGVFFLPHHD